MPLRNRASVSLSATVNAIAGPPATPSPHAPAPAARPVPLPPVACRLRAPPIYTLMPRETLCRSYSPDKKTALEKWSERLTALVSDKPKVVTLKPA